jgi:heme exporter protein B
VIRRLLLCRIDIASGGIIPFVFFVVVASLTVFSVGPDQQLLTRVGPGSLWVAALLAALLPVSTLIAGDIEDGTIDQLRVRGLALETIMATRLVAHWLSFAPALLAAALAGAVMMGVPPRMTLSGLLVATPALAGLGVVAAALVVGARGGAALAGLLVLPLALPVLLFGSGGEMRLLAAASLVLTALAPFAAAAALRANES